MWDTYIIVLISIFLQHLGNPPPSEFEEMVCDACMQKNSFLRVYEASTQVQVEVDVETVDTEKQAAKGKEEEEKSPEEEASENKTKEKCVLKDRVSSSVWNSSGAAYFLQEWRSSLCRCSYCMVSLPSTSHMPLCRSVCKHCSSRM